MSETSKRRDILAQYCRGEGLDIGYGGDPILPTAICIDLPHPYTQVGQHPQHLATETGLLPWFVSNSLDYVYSSHLIEDFCYDRQRLLIREWLRVIRPGGHLVILAPDQQIYLADCRSKGHGSNTCHIEQDMSLQTFVDRVIVPLDLPLSYVHSESPVAVYSWEIVLRKERR